MKAIDKLRAYWNRRERDISYWHPLGTQTVCDASYLNSLFGKEFMKEMDERGYDVSTFKFSIEPKPGYSKFAGQRAEGHDALFLLCYGPWVLPHAELEEFYSRHKPTNLRYGPDYGFEGTTLHRDDFPAFVEAFKEWQVRLAASAPSEEATS